MSRHETQGHLVISIDLDIFYKKIVRQRWFRVSIKRYGQIDGILRALCEMATALFEARQVPVLNEITRDSGVHMRDV